MTKTYQNLIGAEWKAAESGATFTSTSPANHDEVIGEFRGFRTGRRRCGGRRGPPRLPGVERHARPEAWRDPVPHRPAAGRAQGRALAAHDARDGQGAAGGAWRRAGGDRRRVLHGRRGSPPLRADRAVRDARQVRDGHPPPDRRGRHHHALELPGRHPGLEALPGAHLRQHRRHQARLRHPGLPRPLRRAAGRGRPARRRRQRRHRLRWRSRQRDRRPSGRARHQLHRPHRYRRRDQHPRGEDAEAREPRAGRQEPHRGVGGRRPRPRARQRGLVGLRDERPALHRGLAADRASRDPRRLRPSAPTARGQARPRRRPRRRRPMSVRSSTRRPSSASLPTPPSGATRPIWSSAARPARDGDARQGLVLPADHLHRGQARCAHRAGGDLRAGDLGHPGRRLGRDGADRELGQVRPLDIALHPRRQPRVPHPSATSIPGSAT